MAPGLLLLSRLLLAGVVATSFAAVGHAGVDISCESPAAMEGIEQFLGPHVASGALPGVDPAKLAESAALLCAAFVELPEAGHNDVPYQDPAAYLKAIAAFFERLE